MFHFCTEGTKSKQHSLLHKIQRIPRRKSVEKSVMKRWKKIACSLVAGDAAHLYTIDYENNTWKYENGETMMIIVIAKCVTAFAHFILLSCTSVFLLVGNIVIKFANLE